MEPAPLSSGEGKVVADGDGVVMVVFSNAGAWIYSVTVNYDVRASEDSK